MDKRIVRTLGIVVLFGWVGMAAASMQSPGAYTTLREASVPQRFGVFDEPLVPFGTSTVPEDRALKNAIAVYKSAGDPTRTEALDRFLSHYPHSAWRVALLINEGLVYEQTGEFSKAIDRLQSAWAAGRSAKGRTQKAIANRALGGLLRLHTAFGHSVKVQGLLTETTDRILSGAAKIDRTAALEGLWKMRHEPGYAFICGLVALRQLLALESGTHGIEQFKDVQSSVGGMTFAHLRTLATKAGLSARIVFRTGDERIPVPAIVHWKVNHYATIVAESHGRFHIRDAAMGRDFWMSQKAVQAESSGYFLVPTKADKGPWRTAALSEAQRVKGAGITPGNNPTATSNDDPDVRGCDGGGSSGMARYSVKAMLVSLSLHDTPVGYTPPKGPAVPVTIVYNQREANQPANFTFFNLGQKWTSNWLSYVQDNPVSPGNNVMVYLRGGGSRNYDGYNASAGKFSPEKRTGAQLVKVSASPVVYERHLPDGRKEVYSASDGSSYYPRRIFLTRVVDPTGNAVSLNYDSQMHLNTLVDALGQQTTFQYTDIRFPLQITGITDPFGRKATITYDAAGRLTGITDTIGMRSQFTYDSGTSITSMTTPYGTTKFVSGQNGTVRWLEITDPQGLTERVEYRHNAPGMPFSVSPVPTGIQVFNAYMNDRNTYFWDKTTMLRAPGDYTQARVYHWLHEQGLSYRGLTSGVLESIKAPLETRIWYSYPNQPWVAGTGGLDKPSTIARVLDNGTTQLSRIQYNAFGRVIQSIDPRGREVDYAYATNNIDLIKVTRKTASGVDVLAQLTYNGQHKPLTYTDAAGQVTTYSYNNAGQRTSTTDTLGKTTSYTYDNKGYLLSVIDANGKTLRSYTYDGNGRVASITDSEGHILKLAYDTLNRPIAVTYPDGSRRTVTWDKLDPVTTTDRGGRTTHYAYDSLGELISRTDPLGQVTKLNYYANGKLQRLTDPNGNTTTWSRDIEGRVTVKTYADGSRKTYIYDTTGRLKSNTDALGQVGTYTYTVDDRLAGIVYSNAPNPTPAVNFTYDPDYPRPVSHSDGLGTTLYSYYPAGVAGAGKIKTEQGRNSHDSLQYSYDPLYRLASRTVDGATETWRYDALGRLTDARNPLGSFGTTYLGETRQPASERIANIPYQITYQYENNSADRRLKAILNDTLANGNTQPVMDYGFTTSPENLILGRTANNGSGIETEEEDEQQRPDRDRGRHKDREPAPFRGVFAWLFGEAGQDKDRKADRDHRRDRDDDREHEDDDEDDDGGAPVATQYTYDNALRLTGAQGGSTESYTYDPASNLTLFKTGNTRTTMVINNLNQIASAGSARYTYDANGNLLDDGVNTYIWDGANRLLKISNKQTGHTSRFQYDGFSRRVSATETDSGATPVTTRFLWCGQRLCEQRDSSDKVIARYYPQGELRNGQPLFYARDQVGSVVALVDNTGKTIGRLGYDSYGNITSSTGTLPDYRYAGLFHHQASGLYLATYRAYDPKTGRWITADPIGLAGGLNTYGYVGGNPLYWTDPYGLRVLNPNNYTISPAIQTALNNFNNVIGQNNDIVITGGNRSPNSNLGAGSTSQHALGTAADIFVPGQKHLQTANQALQCGIFTGVGWYEEGYRGPNGEGPHVHVDLRKLAPGRTKPAQWGYDKNGNYGGIPAYNPPSNQSCSNAPQSCPNAGSGNTP